MPILSPKNHDLPSFSDYLRAQGYAESTRREWARCLGQYQGSGLAAGAFLGALAQAGYSASYLNKYRQALQAYGRYRQGLGHAPGLALPGCFRGPSQSHPLLSRAQIGALYAACAETPLGLRDRAMLALCYGGGLRRQEAQQVRLSDLRLGLSQLVVVQGKGKRSRTVPLSRGVVADLSRYLHEGRPRFSPQSAALLVSKRGEAIRRPATLNDRFRHLARSVDLAKGIGLHSLRHSIASHLLAAGMSLESIARFLGHQSLDTTQLYTHLKEEADGK